MLAFKYIQPDAQD